MTAYGAFIRDKAFPRLASYRGSLEQGVSMFDFLSKPRGNVPGSLMVWTQGKSADPQFPATHMLSPCFKLFRGSMLRVLKALSDAPDATVAEFLSTIEEGTPSVRGSLCESFVTGTPTSSPNGGTSPVGVATTDDAKKAEYFRELSADALAGHNVSRSDDWQTVLRGARVQLGLGAAMFDVCQKGGGRLLRVCHPRADRVE